MKMIIPRGIWIVGFILSTVTIVVSSGEDSCDFSDGKSCPSDPVELCEIIKEEVIPCANVSVEDRREKEKQAAIEIQAHGKTPDQVASVHGKSCMEAESLAVPARIYFRVYELIGEWCGMEVLNTGTLGISLFEQNGELDCLPISSRKKRQVPTCLYDHNIDCTFQTVDTYRTIDGSCNNMDRPGWGKSFTPLERMLQADYGDGMQTPKLSRSNTALPNTRKISYEISRDTPSPSHVRTFMFVTLGQMVDHDLTQTIKTQVEINGTFVDVPCGNDGCSTTGPENTACLPIDIPTGDYGFPDRSCLKFTRSEGVLANCQESPRRQQLNQITSYLDASHVYGNTAEVLESLRDRSDSDRGKLIVTVHPDESGDFNPLLPQGDDPDCRNILPEEGIRCFKAGDGRVNDQVGLMSLHTLFHRYHNYIEANLHKLNRNWSGEKKFQEARKILIAHWQNIVFGELVPSIVGPDAVRNYGLGLKKKGYQDVYNSNINPGVTNSFSTAAFRFGHSMLPKRLLMVNKYKDNVNNISLAEGLLEPSELYKIAEVNGEKVSMVDSITMGNIFQRAEITDPLFTKQVTDHLFADPPSDFGTDLLAINIQRGRDHGLPGYNKFREFCGLEIYTSFDGMRDIPQAARTKFKSLYEHVDDIDLYAGGVSEKHLNGAAVGPTFACIIASNFERIMKGDRFWFERSPSDSAGFTLKQLNSIKKATLSSVICAVGDDVENIPKYSTLKPRAAALLSLGTNKKRKVYALADAYRQTRNMEGKCSQIHQINFRHWKEKRSGSKFREFTATLIDRTAIYDTLHGMVTPRSGNEHTAEQSLIEFINMITKLAQNNTKLEQYYVATDVLEMLSGSIVFKYKMTFTGDLSLTDSEILTELKNNIGDYDEYGFTIEPEDMTMELDEGLSSTEVALITSGAIVAFILLAALIGLSCCYYPNVAMTQKRWPREREHHSYFNHGIDPKLGLVSTEYNTQPPRSKYDYPRQWKPERIGGVLYNSHQSLYGHQRY